MFTNIGGKLKALAKILCWMGIVLSIIGAILLWAQHGQYNSMTRAYNDTLAAGFVVLIGGCIGSWISSFFMYGFGELIEETARNRQYNEEIYKMIYKHHNPDAEIVGAARAAAIGTYSIEGGKPEKAWKCSKCLGYNSSAAIVCKFCGKNKE